MFPELTDYEFYKAVIIELTEKQIFRWQDIKDMISKSSHRPEDWNDVRVVLKEFINRDIIEKDYLTLEIEQYIVKN